MYNITERFKILGLETAEEYIAKKKIEKEERRRAIEKERTETEVKGKCEFCEWDGDGDDPHLRWIHGDTYICYECFDENLKEESSHCVPSMIAEQTSCYVDEYEWNDLSEEERQIV